MKVTNIKQSHPRLQAIADKSRENSPNATNASEENETLKEGSGWLLAVLWLCGGLAVIGFILQGVTKANIFGALVSPLLFAYGLRVMEREGFQHHGRICSKEKHPNMYAFWLFAVFSMALFCAIAWIFMPHPIGRR
jgi:hypothetical protein